MFAAFQYGEKFTFFGQVKQKKRVCGKYRHALVVGRISKAHSLNSYKQLYFVSIKKL